MPMSCRRAVLDAAVFAGLLAAAPAVAAETASTADSRYAFLLSGRPAGEQTTRRVSAGEWTYHFEFNDRGRGPKQETRLVLGAGGVPVALEITGLDYFKGPVDERFTLAGGKAVWSSSSEKGEAAAAGPAFYIPMAGPPEILAVLARAVLAAPEHRLPLLPSGEARIESLGELTVRQGETSRTVRQLLLSGISFTPLPLWLDGDGTLFAIHDGWSTTIRAGWEGALPELIAAQQVSDSAREAELARTLARRPAQGLAITGARLFDAETGRTVPGTTVVIQGNRIAAVGPDGEVAIPAGAEVVAAAGKALLPGLWDMHVHVSSTDGLLHLAAGVTSVRDLANDTEKLLALRRRWDEGSAIGPRLVMAGFLDGPGPYAGPTTVLVDSEAEVNAAVDRYAALGYEQIKIYSSIRPELVPAIIARAHQHKLRVSGHVPAFMTARQAVEAGFDEIQHVNFLLLNFLFDKVQDTRTPARFTEVGRYAADLDLASEPVRSFVRLLKDRGVTVDPTVNAFEGMFNDRPGQLAAGWADAADRLPAQIRRGLYAGGLPVPEGMDARYREAFRVMLRMVKTVYDAGVPIVAGTDATAGFALHRELELYAEAGIPAPEVLRIATLGAARTMGREAQLGSVRPGKLADLVLVDGNPAARIADVRRVVLTIKDGVVYDPAALYRAVGVKPVE